MLRVGLTGGIGSGKSTVARLLAKHGAIVVDSDAIAREVVAPGTPGLTQLVAEFGPEILAEDGSLNRAELAAQAFADPQRRAVLDGITHPLITARTAELFAAAGHGEIVVHDIPLLTELGLEHAYDYVIVVDASEETRAARLVGRGLTEEDARARMSHQATREQRLAIADAVIENEGRESDLEPAVAELWAELERLGQSKAARINPAR